MKIALLADVHANSCALKAVLDWLDYEKTPVDEIWHLGDLVGYGPDVLNTVELGQQRFDFWISGNHEEFWQKLADLEARGHANFQTDSIINITEQIYNVYERSIKKEAIDPLLRHLRDLHTRPDLDAWLRQGLDLSEHHGPQLLQRGALNLIPVHAAPSSPTEVWLYPWQDRNFLLNHLFRVNEKLLYHDDDDNGVRVPYETPLATRLRPVDAVMKTGEPYLVLFGNSHVPGVYYYEDGQVRAELPSAYGKPYPIEGCPMAINPGSLGHPSDLDPRAAFAILDVTATARQLTFYRVHYETGPVIEKLFNDNYPDDMIKEIETARLRSSNIPNHYYEKLKQLAASPGE